MKFFQKIFSSEVKEIPLSEKIASVESKTSDEIDAAVMGSGPYGEDFELRKAIVEKAGSAALAKLILSNGQDAELINKARTIYGQRLDAGKVSEQEFLSSFNEVELQLSIAANSKNESLHLSILDKIDDETLLEKICVDSHSAKVRQLVADRVTGAEALKRLAKILKSKDKNAYRVIKQKLDAAREEIQRQEALVEKGKKVIEELELLFNRAVDKEFVSRFERQQQRWNELAEALNGAIITDFKQVEEKCLAKIEEFKDALEQERAREEAIEKAKAKLDGVLENINQLVGKLFDLEQFDDRIQTEFRRQFDAEKECWNQTKNEIKPLEKQVKYFTQICEFYESLLERYQVSGTLTECRNRVFSRVDETEDFDADVKYLKFFLSSLSPFSSLKGLDSVVRISDLVGKIEEERKSEKENFEKASKIIGSLIRKSGIAVDQGRIKQAIGVRHSIDEKLQELNVSADRFAKRLEDLDAAIQKLVDWQAYAVVPKKEALIEQMQALVGVEDDPESLASKIKKLQDEWKGLSQSGKDRGEELWDKFSELAEKAYAPCKVHYEELSSLRKQNLERRQQLVQQLEDFYQQYDWEKADWKHVEQIIRASRKELHSYSPVERVANKTVNQQFDVIYDQLQAKLDEEYSKNKASKEVLIEQAKKLVDLSDIQQAVESVKRLQAQWKIIGRCNYRDNDALWKGFREHCDAIFSNKNQQDSERRAAQDEVIDSARAIVTKVEDLAKLEGEALLAARQEKEELQKQFSEVESIPEKVQKALERDLNKALNAFDKQVEGVQDSNIAKAWESFFDIAKKISDSQRSLWSDVDSTSAEEALITLVEANEHWPEGGLSVIKQKLAVNVSKEEAEKALPTQALRLLCVRSEILSNAETPAEDKPIRTEYQLELLQKGLGSKEDPKQAKLQLAKEWAAVVPTESEAEYRELFTRFYNNWKAIA